MKNNEAIDLSLLRWAECPAGSGGALTRRKFTLTEKQVAGEIFAAVCGLGFFDLYVNGVKVTDELLNPVWSDYEERDFSVLLYPMDVCLSHRIYFRKYDIKKFVRVGENVLAAELGNGWYRQTGRETEGKLCYGKALKWSYAVFGDGKILAETDGTEKYKPSDVIFSNVYLGEKQDYAFYEEKWACADYDDKSWRSCPETKVECNVFDFQNAPCDKIMGRLKVKVVKETDGRIVYDCGENTSGFAAVISQNKFVRVRYAELLNENLDLNFSSTGGDNQIQCDEFYSFPAGTKVVPKFCIHGFRYFEVTGGRCEYVCKVHSDVKKISYFHCGDKIINGYHEAFVRSMLSNLHSGVPSDCPHRERLGYTGDGQLTCKAAMLTLSVKELYKKWIYDIFDCQDLKTGRIQNTAPFYGGGGGPGGWGCAVVFAPYYYYETYGDTSVLKDALKHIDFWIENMLWCSENGLVTHTVKGHWCLGDWCTPEDILIPAEIVNTYYFVKALEKAAEIRKFTGTPEKISYYKQIADRCRKALKKKYVIKGMPRITDNAADAFLIDLGLCDKQAERTLCERYADNLRFDTGIFGTKVLIKVLFERGFGETAVALLGSKLYPSFGYMINHGATTLWERWDGDENWSHNHHMFGGAAEYLYTYLAGIKISHGKFDAEIQPCFVRRALPITCRMKIKDGNIEADYRACENGDIKVTVQVEKIKARIKINGKTRVLKSGLNEIYVN